MLQRRIWIVGSTIDELFQSFKTYLRNNYGIVENIAVVIDGRYLLPSTKDSTHIRRSKGRLGIKIVPSLNNPVVVKKVDFLLNNHNKQALLEMLGSQFPASCLSVMNSDGDAGMDIVSSALTIAKTCLITFLGENTDLLILLYWH